MKKEKYKIIRKKNVHANQQSNKYRKCNKKKNVAQKLNPNRIEGIA